MQDIVDGDEFTTISEAKLVEILSSDQLVVDKEETVFYACLSWLQVRHARLDYNLDLDLKLKN